MRILDDELDEKNYPCPCCGFLTISNQPPGTFEICPVCDWEDDDVQFYNIEFKGGANKECLEEAKENYKNFKAVSKRFLNDVRPPSPDEIP